MTGQCLNCGTPLTGPFCPQCGQKASETDPTLRTFLQDTTQELTDLDGKVPRTVVALFTKPGLLTKDFLAGRRARWIPPLRIYLFASLAYFLSGPLVDSLTHRKQKAIARIGITDSTGSTTLTPQARQDLEKSRVAQLIGVERLVRATEDDAKLSQTISSAFPKAMFILLPLFALLTRIAWRRALPHYPAHLYLAVHLHAGWFAALTVAELLSIIQSVAFEAVLGISAAVYVVGYALIALRRVFNESWGRTIAKTAGIAVVYLACFAGVSVALLVYAVSRM